MAKGRQIYLQAEEINRLHAMVEWEIVRQDEENERLRGNLTWAIAKARSQPEGEKNDSLRRYVMQIRHEIVEERVIKQKLRNLLEKLWYYG